MCVVSCISSFAFDYHALLFFLLLFSALCTAASASFEESSESSAFVEDSEGSEFSGSDSAAQSGKVRKSGRNRK